MLIKKSEFQFKNPEIKEIEFYTHEQFNSEIANIDIKISPSISQTDIQNSAKVTLEVIVGGESDASPFFLRTKISSLFTWENDTENVDDLLNINAPTLLISYLRPIITNITDWSKYPKFKLPFINMVDIYEK